MQPGAWDGSFASDLHRRLLWPSHHWQGRRYRITDGNLHIICMIVTENRTKYGAVAATAATAAAAAAAAAEEEEATSAAR